MLNDVRRACAVAIALGHLPIDIASNMGIRFLISHFSRKNSFPSGLSARSIGRELKDLYEEQLEAGKKKIASALVRYDAVFLQDSILLIRMNERSLRVYLTCNKMDGRGKQSRIISSALEFSL